MSTASLDIRLEVNEHAMWRLGATFRRLTRSVGSLRYIGQKPLTDIERYTLKLARRHVAEGRTDLAAEDFRWLGERYEVAAPDETPVLRRLVTADRARFAMDAANTARIEEATDL